MRVLVCGGRDFNDKDLLCRVLRDIPITHVIHGAARGADSLAGWWAECSCLPCTSYPANWVLHKKAAGHIRNAQMLKDGRPDLVVAFPGGRGTEDMVAQARAAGVKVMRVGRVEDAIRGSREISGGSER